MPEISRVYENTEDQLNCKYNYKTKTINSLQKTDREEAYPLESITSLEIFIFFVVPLYKSSKLQGKVRSIAAAFLGTLADPSPGAPLNEAKISSPNIPLGNPDALAREPGISPNGLENPKNSENISSGFLVLNRNDVGPPLPPPLEKPPEPGGGACPFKPSSPY